MNLKSLINKLIEAGRIKPSRLSNIKISARRYAAALGCQSLEDCPEELFVLNKPTRNQKIEDYLGDAASPYVFRKTKGDIDFLLRTAAELKILSSLPQAVSEMKEKTLGRRKIEKRLPTLTAFPQTNLTKEAYGLPLDKWPNQLRQQYDDWLAWVTTPRAKIAGADSFNRPATIDTKRKTMEAYFGFLRNVRGTENLDFRMLMDVGSATLTDDQNVNFVIFRSEPLIGLLEEFIGWHQIRHDGKLNSHVISLFSLSISVAHKYYFLKAVLNKQNEAADRYRGVVFRIEELRRSLIKPNESRKPVLPKLERAVDKHQLLRAAKREFPRSEVLTNQQSGTVTATNAGRAVAIMLLLEHSLRNKNLREARLSQNLFKNRVGKWILTFREDEESAPVGYQKRRNNFAAYEGEVGEQTAVYLDKYLTFWRPKLILQIDRQIEELRASNSDEGQKIRELEQHKDYLFLNSQNSPFNVNTFSTWIERGTYRWLGVRINPELIRHIAIQK